jgi:hypothetical protein
VANGVCVAPQLLRWAREHSGRSVEELERRFPKLSEWEAGEGQPTLRQLQDYAHATCTPVGFLFLVEPPEEQLPIPAFRTPVRTLTPDLQDTIYACKQHQDSYREFADANGRGRVELVGSLSVDVDVNDAAAQLRGALGFDLARRVVLSPLTAALSGLREHAEEAGIQVIISGIAGTNTHRNLNPDEFRGLALFDELAPLVFINGADTKAAQIFTLAHELVHIALGEPTASRPDLDEIEGWCDRVAAKLLDPAPGRRGSYRQALTPSARSLRAQPAANTSWTRTADHAVREADMRRHINPTLDRPVNQARRERTGGPYPVEDGLTFGSTEELQVYQALKRLQASFPQEDTISIAPLPGAYLREGHTWSPDVLVLGRGRALIVETDGPHHRSPRRYVDDRNRDLQWQRCGVPVVRLAVEDLQDGAALVNRLREEIMRHLRHAG